MRYCHPDYFATLVDRHVIDTLAQVLRRGQVIAEFPILDGVVEVSRSDELRRRATVTLADPDGTLTPRRATDMLTPFGTELRLWRGIKNPSGGSNVGWLHPVATVAISNPKVNDTGDGLTISLDGFDRARRIRRNPWRDPYPLAAMNYVTAVETALKDRLPTIEVRSEVARNYLGPPVVFGLDSNVDPWAELTTFANAAGIEMFFDAMGVCVLRGFHETAHSAVTATYAEGTTARNLIALERDLDETDTYSRVLVTSESSTDDVKYWGMAWDNDPTSPTYIGGDFGDVCLSLTSKHINSVDQAIDYASLQFRLHRGLSETVRMSLIPNAAHEEGDVIQVVRDRAGVSSLYVLDAFSVPFGPTGVMSATTATRRVLTTGQ